MIKLQVFYLLRIYWPITLIKLRLKKSAQKAHKLYKTYFKKHCKCAYVLQPGKVLVICSHCGGQQKHGRFK